MRCFVTEIFIMALAPVPGPFFDFLVSLGFLDFIELLQEFLLALRHMRWNLNLKLHEQVALAVTFQSGHALIGKTYDFPGLSAWFDLKGLFGPVQQREDDPIFEPLRDRAVFEQVSVDPEINTIAWPNGADFAPEFLRELVRPHAVA